MTELIVHKPDDDDEVSNSNDLDVGQMFIHGEDGSLCLVCDEDRWVSLNDGILMFQGDGQSAPVLAVVSYAEVTVEYDD